MDYNSLHSPLLAGYKILGMDAKSVFIWAVLRDLMELKLVCFREEYETEHIKISYVNFFHIHGDLSIYCFSRVGGT